MTRDPLVWGAAAGAALMLLLAAPAGTALGDLDAARAERARLQALLAADPTTPPAIDGAAASAALATEVRRLGARGAVLVEEVVPGTGTDGLARVRLRLSGSEDAVLALTDQLERGTRRFRGWRAEAAGGAVRVSGELAALPR